MNNSINPWLGLEKNATAERTPLLEKQRKLHAYAEEILRATEINAPLRPELANWLAIALKNISFGEDAEECLNIKPNKPGQTKKQFLKEVMRNHANGLVAAMTEKGDPDATTQNRAFDTASALGTKASTVRKNWNSKNANRNPTFTLADE